MRYLVSFLRISLIVCSDDEIEGIEQAESREDEERVDEQTWRAEMQVEREDREFDAELERVAENQAQKSPGSSH